MTPDAAPILLPQPRRLRLHGGTVPASTPIVERGARDLPAQGYRLEVDDDRVRLEVADGAGEFYGRATLAQLEHAEPGRLPRVEIEDWPDLPVRGVMLDISRDKVPTMETLFALVDRLAGWKVNQLQLYTEHAFAYSGHEEVWREASPMTAAEVRALDLHCAARHVELVPNQNCLGHMERWLRHDRYRPLALAPEGYRMMGMQRDPSTIDPANPESFALVRGLLAELLPNFTSRRVHVGLDEPWELPAERVGEYADWLDRLRALPDLAGREVLVWGDILANHRELLSRVPDGVTVCEWGYDADSPFDARTAALADAGVPFWVCPGTASWLSLVGRLDDVRAGNAAAVAAALAHGGRGFLTTDWGDMGHHQYLPVSEPGFAYGAAVSWCLDANRDLDLAAALDAHCYDDPAGELGGALCDLARVYKCTDRYVHNVASVNLHFWFPNLPVGAGGLGLTADDYERVEAALDAAEARLARSRARRSDAGLVQSELANAIALVRVLARDGRSRVADGGDGTLASISEGVRAALAAELAVVLHAHRDLWLSRNRPGGLPDSCAWIEHLADCYRTGTATSRFERPAPA